MKLQFFLNSSSPGSRMKAGMPEYPENPDVAAKINLKLYTFFIQILPIVLLFVAGTSKLYSQSHGLPGFFEQQKTELFRFSVSGIPREDLPDSQALTIFRMAYSYLEKEDYANSLAGWTKFISLRPMDYEGYCNRGLVFLILGNMKKAHTDLEKSLSLKHNAAALFDMGYLHYLQGRNDSADYFYTQAIQEEPDKGIYLSLRAMNKLMTGDLDGAEKDSRKALETDSFWYSFTIRGYYFLNIEEPDNALKFLSKAVKLNPSHSETHMYLWTAYTMLEDSSNAMTELTTALKLDPCNPDAAFTMAIIKKEMGLEVEYNEIIERINHCNPENSAFYMERSKFYMELEEPEKALSDALHAYSQDKTQIEVLVYLVDIYMELEKSDSALKMADVLISLDTLNDRAYAIRANIFAFLEKNTSALKDYNRMISIRPSSKNYLERARFRLNMKDFTGALNDLNEAIRLDPDNSEAYYQRGSAKFIQGFKKEGCDDIRKAAGMGNKSAGNVMKETCLYYK